MALRAIVLAIVLVSPSVASGQCNADRLFDEGRARSAAGDYTAASDLFRRSLQCAPRPATAFNLSAVLRRRGRLVESVDLLEALLHGSYGPLGAREHEQVQALLGQTRPRIATLRVEGADAVGIDVRIDGERVTIADGRATIRVDPGTHVVTASAPGRVPWEERVALIEGASETAVVRLDPAPTARTAPSPQASPALSLRAPSRAGSRPRDESGGGVLSSPWLWVGIGVAVAVGVGVALAIVLSGGTAEPYEPVLGNHETLWDMP